MLCLVVREDWSDEREIDASSCSLAVVIHRVNRQDVIPCIIVDSGIEIEGVELFFRYLKSSFKMPDTVHIAKVMRASLLVFLEQIGAFKV